MLLTSLMLVFIIYFYLLFYMLLNFAEKVIRPLS
jgi:hypothetical protein